MIGTQPPDRACGSIDSQARLPLRWSHNASTDAGSTHHAGFSDMLAPAE